jgi:hypothetical protein
MLGDPVANPDFGTWALAYVTYCDGSSYTSNRDEPIVDPASNTTLYFRGAKALRALVGDMMEVCPCGVVASVVRPRLPQWRVHGCSSKVCSTPLTSLCRDRGTQCARAA